MSLDGINFSARAGQVGKFLNPANLGKTAEVKSATVGITGTNTTTRSDLSSTISDISNRARVNSPEAQGLSSAQEIEKGQLVSGYHFDNLGPHDAKIFAYKYNSANTPSIAQATANACENIEYAGVAGNLQAAAKNSPFAELFG